MASLFFLLPLVTLLPHNLFLLPAVTASTSLQPQNYYSPDPHHPTPLTGSHHRRPSHGSSPPHSSGGHCGPSPTRPSRSPPYHHEPPTTHPSPPSGGGGGGGGSGSGGGGYYHSPPSTPPVVITPPTPTVVPVTPSMPSSPPPVTIDPNNPPFTCVYWSHHPGLIWGLLGWWGTVGGVFGVSSFPGLQADTSLQQALSNTRTDGFGALYREGAASFLNSMADSRFPFTSKQVKDAFTVALASNKDAAAQARLFKLANENRLIHSSP
ncbi:hypothetical protein Ancab_012907 [Ancistrocladus abbreviatus]